MNIGIIAQQADIRQWLVGRAGAVASVQPAWADPGLTWVDLDFEGREATSVRFVRSVGGVEVSQWAAVRGETLALEGEPRIGEIPNDLIDEMSPEGAARAGVRVAQFIAVAERNATDISELTLSDLRRLAGIAGTSVSGLFASLVASGVKL